MEILAKRLKWLREKQRYSQKEIASEVGMTPSGYQKIEYGDRDPKLDVLVRICNIFKVSSDFLLGINDIVGNLEELSNKILILQNRKKEYSRHLEIINHSLYEIENKKGIPRDYGEIELKNRELMLQQSKASVEKDLYETQEKFREVTYDYIKEILDIPSTIPHKNSIIKLLQPFSIEIQPNLFDEFALAFFCNEGFIENFGVYETEEDAREARKEMLIMFNGK
jgi:transcriptional regulator with XRE-family HTH domain